MTKFDSKAIVVDQAAAPTNVAYLTSIGHATTSAQIRFLLTQGYSRAQVAKALNKRYQHVRNVEITPIKKTQA
jgi:hypothetical protein